MYSIPAGAKKEPACLGPVLVWLCIRGRSYRFEVPPGRAHYLSDRIQMYTKKPDLQEPALKNSRVIKQPSQ